MLTEGFRVVNGVGVDVDIELGVSVEEIVDDSIGSIDLKKRISKTSKIACFSCNEINSTDCIPNWLLRCRS